MYTLAIVGVYACLASGGESDRGPACLPIPLPEKHREAAADLTLSLSKAPHPLPATPDPLLGKGSIKKGQPPHSSCSLIPKGFHYIYFIPYI